MKSFLQSLFLKPVLLGIFFIVTGFSYGQSIWTNPIEDSSPSSSNPYTNGDVKDPNITVSGVGFGSGLTANAGSDRFNTKGWTNTASPDMDDYFTFTLTPNSGYKINFVSLDFTLQRSNTGPSAFVVRSSLDNFATDIQSITASGTSGSAKTVALSNASFQNVASAITFRIYGYSATGATGTSSINDFIFNGQVVNVLGTDDFERSRISYYPNPVKNILYFSAASPIIGVNIYNLSGQLVLAVKNTKIEIQNIDLSSVQNGIYLVKISTTDSEKTMQLVKQ